MNWLLVFVPAAMGLEAAGNDVHRLLPHIATVLRIR
jgi:hypothetical protein